MRPNNICCIGGDQIGRAACCIIAFKSPEVRVTVLNIEKDASEWSFDTLQFREPDLDQIIKKCRNRNLFFNSDYESVIKDADMIFLSVNVPIKTVRGREGRTMDFKELEDVAKLVAIYSESDKIVVEKTEVSGRATEKISNILKSSCRTGVRHQVLSKPEFVIEGSIVKDLLNPDLVVIGCQNNPTGRAAAESLCELYERWVPRKKIIIINHWSAELYKLAANAFLAQRLCSVNSLATICEETGTNFDELIRILRKDSTIGSRYLNPSLGFGGLQDDISNLVFMCESLKLPETADYWRAVVNLNDYQIKRFIEKIISVLGTVENKDITVWGFSYKKSTYDTKNSPAIEVCKWLLKEKCNLRIYDPKVQAKQIRKDLELGDAEEGDRNIQISTDAYLSSSNSSAVIICTDRDEFAQLDYSKLAKWMKTPIVIDGRKFLKKDSLKDLGIEYYTIGVTDSHSAEEV